MKKIIFILIKVVLSYGCAGSLTVSVSEGKMNELCSNSDPHKKDMNPSFLFINYGLNKKADWTLFALR